MIHLWYRENGWKREIEKSKKADETETERKKICVERG